MPSVRSPRTFVEYDLPSDHDVLISTTVEDDNYERSDVVMIRDAASTTVGEVAVYRSSIPELIEALRLIEENH